MRCFGVDEYAVSPVIGVVAMVGMTVIMVSAVTVSVFSFSIPERAPQARIVVVEAKGDLGETALNKSSITLKHKGGDALFENNTRIIITGKDMHTQEPTLTIRLPGTCKLLIRI
jgi:FlaG/FlaF family flagellin (archaellin)